MSSVINSLMTSFFSRRETSKALILQPLTVDRDGLVSNALAPFSKKIFCQR
jgi:hypothetical protein